MHNKTVIITGGGQGIGRCISGFLLENGINVAAMDIDLEAGKECCMEFATTNYKFIDGDVTSENNVRRLIEKTAESFGRIDGLVNNTGIGICKKVENLSLDEWNKVISTNLTSAFLAAKFAIPHLRRTNGAIVNISSTRALQSEADTEAYSASKGGLLALTHSLAVSLAGEIRVNCVSPGWIDVSNWKKESMRKQAALSEMDHKQHPAGRVGTPHDIAEMVLFLLSPEKSGFITGHNFIVDGGMTKKMIYV